MEWHQIDHHQAGGRGEEGRPSPVFFGEEEVQEEIGLEGRSSRWCEGDVRLHLDGEG